MCYASCPEGIVPDDVRPCLEISQMNIADHFWLGQREEVAVVQQALCRVPKALPEDVRFRHSISADGRAHRSIDDGNSTLEDLFQRMLAGSRHVFLMTLGSLRFGLNFCLNFATLLQNMLLYYSDWQYVQALPRVITDVIVIALKRRWTTPILDPTDPVSAHIRNI